jgi:hypothetical protein
VEGDDANDRERAQSIDIGPEIERRRGSRRDEVRRVEGFVQRIVLSAAGETRPLPRDGVDRRAAIGKRLLSALPCVGRAP